MTSALNLDLVDGIAVVTIDLPGESVNKVTSALRIAFAEMFEKLEGDSAVRGVVLASGKPDTWIAGADIDEFLTLRTAAEAEALSRNGQDLLARLESCACPSSRPSMARVSAAGSRRPSPAAIVSRRTTPRRCSRCRKYSSGSSPALAERSGFPGSLGYRARST